MTDTLMLIDGHSIAFRAYYALPESIADSDGRPTNAIYGFCNMLFKLLQDEQPAYVAVVFDHGRPFREEIYPLYKEGRQEIDPEVKVQVRRLRPALQALDIPMYQAEGYEADDVIATLTRQALERTDMHVLIVSGDRDLFALAGERVTILYPQGAMKDAKRYTPEEVRARWGIEPAQVPLFKALVGDSSDNIPGVSGIGKKTAATLLAKYNSLDEIYDNLNNVSTRARNRLDGARETAEMSHQLATLIDAVPDVELDLERPGLAYDPEDVDAAFDELDFGGIRERVPASRA